MGWLKNGELACDGCKLIFDFPGPQVLVINAARAYGWHCYRGPSQTGLPLEKYLCAECAGTARKALVSRPALEGQEPLPLKEFEPETGSSA